MLDDRFWTKVDRTAPGGCWEWMANRNNKGYGLFRPGGIAPKKLAHRLSYEAAKGKIPKGLFVLHSCDNPRCVNPGHLSLGSSKDNVKDMDDRGRRVTTSLRGTRNPFAKTTDADVIAIRRAYVAGTPTDDICRQYGIASVSDYMGRAWTHLFDHPDCPSVSEIKAEAARRTRNNSLLTKEAVVEIRKKLASGARGIDLAAQYGVHKATISDIKLRKIWADI